MTILSAQSIRKLCVDVEHPMIEPFHERKITAGRSGGLSCAGYDITLAQDRWIWPLWMRLGSTVERFQVPKDIMFGIVDKSTNIRHGFTVFNTTAEPGWQGWLTVEMMRVKPWPSKVKKGTPIAQAVFWKLDEETEQPYQGKYQDQGAAPQPAIMEDGLDSFIKWGRPDDDFIPPIVKPRPEPKSFLQKLDDWVEYWFCLKPWSLMLPDKKHTFEHLNQDPLWRRHMAAQWDTVDDDWLYSDENPYRNTLPDEDIAYAHRRFEEDRPEIFTNSKGEKLVVYMEGDSFVSHDQKTPVGPYAIKPIFTHLKEGDPLPTIERTLIFNPELGQCVPQNLKFYGTAEYGEAFKSDASDEGIMEAPEAFKEGEFQDLCPYCAEYIKQCYHPDICQRSQNPMPNIYKSEHVLEDDYPVYVGYFYLGDGVVVTSPVEGFVSDLKRALQLNEVRRCDANERGLLKRNTGEANG